MALATRWLACAAFAVAGSVYAQQPQGTGPGGTVWRCLEQVLGRRVDVEDAELRIEHDDRRAEQIETGEGRRVHPPLRPGCAA